jgi:ubiquinone/menaquinone biosynthesis C-methylase UbiE
MAPINGEPRNTKTLQDRPLSDHVCPWWLCFIFDNPLRRFFQNPRRILSPYVKEGWTVLDVGPGMGYYTIPLARIVGPTGKVIAADLQEKMLKAVHSRAVKAGVEKRIVLHQAKPDSIGVIEPVDFCLAFWMVHEVPDKKRFLGQIAAILKPGGLLLFVEPKLHVSQAKFLATVQIAAGVGFQNVERPSIFISNAVLFKKGA